MAEWEKQIFAINLIVGDLERSKTFYREVFGLAPLDEEEDLAIFRLKDTYVALRHDPDHQAAPPPSPIRAATSGGSRKTWPSAPRGSHTKSKEFSAGTARLSRLLR